MIAQVGIAEGITAPDTERCRWGKPEELIVIYNGIALWYIVETVRGERSTRSSSQEQTNIWPL